MYSFLHTITGLVGEHLNGWYMVIVTLLQTWAFGSHKAVLITCTLNKKVMF